MSWSKSISCLQVIEVLQVRRLEACEEDLDDVQSHLPAAAIGTSDRAQEGQAAGVLLRDGWGLVGRSVFDNDPKCGQP